MSPRDHHTPFTLYPSQRDALDRLCERYGVGAKDGAL